MWSLYASTSTINWVCGTYAKGMMRGFGPAVVYLLVFAVCCTAEYECAGYPRSCSTPRTRAPRAGKSTAARGFPSLSCARAPLEGAMECTARRPAACRGARGRPPRRTPSIRLQLRRAIPVLPTKTTRRRRRGSIESARPSSPAAADNVG